MERKIGEIFEYNGEWYQCVESDCCAECSLFTTECGSGTKSELADEMFGECSKIRRSDNKHVIFKKLEKVGESYSKYVFPRGNVLVQRYKLHIPCDTNVSNGYWIYHWNEKLVDIEIKQIKEDMKEKKVKVSRENWDYLVDKLQYILADHLHGGESDEVITEFENLLEIDNPEEKNLKPFDLEAAKAGNPVCTRDGRKARIICFDLNNDEYPIVVAITNNGEENEIHKYSIDGKICTISTIKEDDLMMLPEKKEGWVNLYRDEESKRVYCGEFIFSEREKAEKHYECNDTKVATVSIGWEE